MNHSLGKDREGDDMRTRLSRGKCIRYLRIRSLDERDEGLDPLSRDEPLPHESSREVRIRQRRYSPKI